MLRRLPLRLKKKALLPRQQRQQPPAEWDTEPRRALILIKGTDASSKCRAPLPYLLKGNKDACLKFELPCYQVEALMERLLAARGQGVKSIIFSQFLGMMGLIQAALTAKGISFARIDGSTSASARAKVVIGRPALG